jgi:hypothetical protein
MAIFVLESRLVLIFARVKAAGDERGFVADLISRKIGGQIAACHLRSQ